MGKQKKRVADENLPKGDLRVAGRTTEKEKSRGKGANGANPLERST